ncbi:MAG: SH3 domain-containing protein [Chloroflexi bacterium]|nr:MAG: SH3 domain-containing protein [Chloroflexota bacterium]
MARYQIPPDPRKSPSSAHHNPSPTPWIPLVLGILVTVIGLLLGGILVNAFLFRPPLDAGPIAPTIIVLTAPPTVTATATPAVATPTPIPTFTPVPTPNVAVPPETITPGFYARVVNTDGLGVTVRGGPSISNLPLTVAPEGDVLLVLDGPVEGNGFLWWQVRLEDGTEGWVAGDFLTPAPAPSP